LIAINNPQALKEERDEMTRKLRLLLSVLALSVNEFLFFDGDDKPAKFGANPLCLLNVYDEAVVATVKPFACFTKQMFLAAPIDRLTCLLKQPDLFRGKEPIYHNDNTEEREEGVEFDDKADEENGRRILSSIRSEEGARFSLNGDIYFGFLF